MTHMKKKDVNSVRGINLNIWSMKPDLKINLLLFWNHFWKRIKHSGSMLHKSRISLWKKRRSLLIKLSNLKIKSNYLNNLSITRIKFLGDLEALPISHQKCTFRKISRIFLKKVKERTKQSISNRKWNRMEKQTTHKNPEIL